MEAIWLEREGVDVQAEVKHGLYHSFSQAESHRSNQEWCDVDWATRGMVDSHGCRINHAEALKAGLPTTEP